MIIVYLLGALFAIIVGAHFDIIRFLFVYAILLTGTLSALYNNNYNDVETDRYASQTFFSGGSRILVDHPEFMKSFKRLSLFFLCFSILLGLVAMILFSYPWTFFLFILFGNLLGWFYTAPPLQLIYHGFGEFGTMCAAGFIIPGLGYFALKGQIDTMFLPLLLPLLLYGFSMSFYLEIPDREADRRGHKNTMVVRWGIPFGLTSSVLSTFAATLCFVIYGFSKISSGTINYWIVSLFSLLPFIVSFYTWIRSRIDINRINHLIFYSAASFFAFYLLLIGYLFILVLQM